MIIYGSDLDLLTKYCNAEPMHKKSYYLDLMKSILAAFLESKGR